MSKSLAQWLPSESTLDLIRLNGIGDMLIRESLEYLKAQPSLSDISDIDGYDNWNTFFIMFCLKAHSSTEIAEEEK